MKLTIDQLKSISAGGAATGGGGVQNAIDAIAAVEARTGNDLPDLTYLLGGRGK